MRTIRDEDGDGGHLIENATVVHETERAVLVEASDFLGAEWIPKSAIHDDSEVWESGDGPGGLYVKEWFAEKQGWI